MTWQRTVEQLGTVVYKISLSAIYLFSIIPVLIVFVMALGPSQHLEFPPQGITLQWYIEAVSQFSQYIQPLIFSLEIAFIVALLATSLGTMAALALIRYKPRYANLLQGSFSAPLTVPQIVIGLAVLIFFYQVNLPTGRVALIVGHTIIGVPFVMIFVSISLRQMDESLELSARDLGADKYQSFLRITLPLIKPGVFAGAIFAFIMSYNNVPISLFLIRPGGETTIPMVIFQNLEYGFTPTLAAIAVIQVAVVFIVIAVANLFTDVTEVF
jgi:ABC-type spermidine/putrescine transport system permease subunit II